jgi:hypothetical protein
MATTTYCPDCGGVIGAKQTTDAGKPCTCSKNARASDTVDEPELQIESASTSGEKNDKVCCSCGKDLRGHRRWKDSAGYWCKDCHRVDRARNTVPEQRCQDCGRMKPLDKLKEYDGEHICVGCAKIRDDEKEIKQRKLEAKMAAEELQTKNFRKWMIIGIAMSVLILIAMLAQLFG